MAKDHTVCPGATLMRQPAPEIFVCKNCGEEVEIWSDELRAECSNCGKYVVKDGEMACLEWCKMAEECVGTDTFNKYMKNKALTVKQKLLEELENHFGEDIKRIKHAQKVLQYAEQLLQNSEADAHIVVPASILHDIGIKEAEEKHNSNAGKHQEELGPEIAKKILLKQGLAMETIDEICDIIGHHHSPREEETENFKILYDSDSIVNLEEFIEKKSKEELIEFINKTFLTPEGKELALKEYSL
jgi:HD superfamily phosphodiesterase/DNA-directed RNA polymerase subunit RPC12/RpoP